MSGRLLGRSGLVVSEVGLGTATFGSTVDECTAASMVGAYIDGGGTFVDTADSYADGASETILGRALGSRRDAVVLSSKVGLPTDGQPSGTPSSRRRLRRAIEHSLRRLRTDRIDLYHLHRWDSAAPLEESLSTLDDLVREGKVLHVALSNFAGWQLALAVSLAVEHGWEPPIAVQARYSLASRDAEREVLPFCRWAGLGVVAWSPLAGGLLTGKYARGTRPPAGTRAADAVLGASLRRRFTDRGFAIVDAVLRVAKDREEAPASIALAWLLARRGIASVVVGVTGCDQLRQALASASLSLTGDELDALDRASAFVRGYPYDLLRELGSAGPEDEP